MLNVAERESVAVGVNVTPIEQFPPATTFDPQLFVCRKSPGLVPPKRDRRDVERCVAGVGQHQALHRAGGALIF
jgi:hypothetical protein